MPAPLPASRASLVRFASATASDRAALARCTIDPASQVDDGFDYSRVVVRKPWGYEYLMFQNASVAVWILRLLPGASTSLHCHQRKTTSLAVLSGEACCRSLDGSVTRKAGEGVLIGPGVFHQTTALSADGVFLMEIESPVHKRDLVRLSDAYGRSGLGYESAEHMTVNTANYNRLSFLGESIFYNTRKRFRDTTVRLVRSDAPAPLATATGAGPGDLVGILSGQVCDPTDHLHAAAGQFANPQAPDLHVSAGFAAVVVSYRDLRARAADVIIGHLRQRGVTRFFFAPGTTNAHLVDAVAREGEGAFIPQTSDAAAAQAAVAYAKLTGRPACCLLSSGAAAASAVPSVAEAWADSAPVVFLCAQTRLARFPRPSRALRQLANKEIAGAHLVGPITKLALAPTDAATLPRDLDRALRLATRGRAGPVWLDLPLDLLGQVVDEARLRAPSPRTSTLALPRPADVAAALDLLAQARRPVVLLGHGIRASGGLDAALALIRRFSLPVLTTRRGADLVPADEPLGFGRPGTYGHAAANAIVRECDVLLCLGARLELPLVGRNHHEFAPQAALVVVDVDTAELRKPTIRPALRVRSDARTFLHALIDHAAPTLATAPAAWLARCAALRDHADAPLSSAPSSRLDAFAATHALSSAAPDDAIVIAEGGAPLDYVMRAWRFRAGQRLVASTGLEGDAFSLAAAVGACVAFPGRRVLCLCEAGAFLRSTPELATLLAHQLPVSLFIYCAADDFRVRETQARYFGERHVAAAPQHRLAQDVVSQCLAAAGVPALRVANTADLAAAVRAALPARGLAVGLFQLADEARPASGPVYSVRHDGRWEVAAAPAALTVP